MTRYEIGIGLHYLRPKKGAGFLSVMAWITVCGILVGVMALVVALSLASGFEGALRDKIIGVNAHLLLLRFDGPVADWEGVREKLRGFPEVATVVPFTYEKALIRSQRNVRGIVVRGIRPGDLSAMSTWQPSFVCGGLQPVLPEVRPGEVAGGIKGPIWIGKVLAEDLEVSCGDPVDLVALASGTGVTDHEAAFGSYRVAGVLEVGMYEYDASLAFLPLAEAQDLFGLRGRVTGLEVRLHDIGETEAMKRQIQEEMGYPFWVKTWKEMNPNFFSALKIQKVVMFLVLVLILLVGGFNIVSTLIMNVMEKRREVAILRAIGAPARSVSRIFFVQGVSLGMVGTGLGILLGVGVCRLLDAYPLIRLDPEIYYLSHLPVEIRPAELWLIGLCSVVLCVLATLYPARKASMLDPAEVLRYE